MKKILQIIAVIILFLISSIIFWAGLAPDSFYRFMGRHPEIIDQVNQSGLFKDMTDQSGIVPSEPVSAKNGELTVNGETWPVEIASTEADRVNGLSNRRFLYSKKGMLFAFDQEDNQGFWMKDMLIPIDMIFFDHDWKIVLIESNLSANSFPKVFGREIKSQYVLEINAGEAVSYGLTVGKQAVFKNK